MWVVAAGALAVPWIAMRFTTEVAWTLSDFVVFGAMLLFVCGGFELAARLSGNRAYRLAMGIALLGTFFLVWINLAVGIIGNESNPLNLVFFAVPVVGLVGALIARFEPLGMARSLLATACAQALAVFVAALASSGIAVVLSVFYVLLWLTSAQLFRIASRERRPAG